MDKSRPLPEGRISIFSEAAENRLTVESATGKLFWDDKEVLSRKVIDFRNVDRWVPIVGALGVVVGAFAAIAAVVADVSQGTCGTLFDWHVCKPPVTEGDEGRRVTPIVDSAPPQCKVHAFQPLYFDSNFASLKLESAATLEKALETLSCDRALQVEVRGYTDISGTVDQNIRISQLRADTVAGWLVRHGVAPDRVLTRAFGAAAPVADNSTPEGRAANRRVEILKR